MGNGWRIGLVGIPVSLVFITSAAAAAVPEQIGVNKEHKHDKW